VNIKQLVFSFLILPIYIPLALAWLVLGTAAEVCEYIIEGLLILRDRLGTKKAEEEQIK